MEDKAGAPVAAAAPAARMRSLEKSSQSVSAGYSAMADAYEDKRKGGASVEAAAQWLASIEANLDTGKDAEVLDQWRKFRRAYPDYAVPPALEERIKAIQK
jgi:hypothetical protein